MPSVDATSGRAGGGDDTGARTGEFSAPPENLTAAAAATGPAATPDATASDATASAGAGPDATATATASDATASAGAGLDATASAGAGPDATADATASDATASAGAGPDATATTTAPAASDAASDGSSASSPPSPSAEGCHAPGADPRTTGAPSATGEEDVARAVAGRRGVLALAVRWWWLALLLLALLPVLVGIPHLLTQWSTGALTTGDRAVTALSVRDIGHREVFVGPYSREGWSHPGPALFYLLFGPYRLFGGADVALPVTALLVNGAAIVLIALAVRRRLGAGVMLWALLVVALYLRLIQPGLLQDVWNPVLPVLPFTAMVLLCWCAVRGDAWAVPVALGIGSFCVQSHVGLAAGVGAAFGVSALGLLVQLVRVGPRAAFTGRLGRRVRRTGYASVAVLAVLWALPVWQQLTGHPGNLSAIWHYFRRADPSWTMRDGARVLATQLGRPVAYLAGITPTGDPLHLRPARLPAWTGLVALVAFAAAWAESVRRRWSAIVWAGGFAAVLALAGVVAASRIVGPMFDYLVLWTMAPALLVWVVVGAVAVRLVTAGVRAGARVPRADAGDGAPLAADQASNPAASDPAPARAGSGSGPLARGARIAVGGVLVVALAALSVATTKNTVDGRPDSDPALRPLASAVLDWLGPTRRHDQVRLDFAPTLQPTLAGTSWPGSGLLLALRTRGVDARVSSFWSHVYGPRLTRDPDKATIVVVLAFADGVSPGPAPGQRLLARSGDLQVYVGPGPAASPSAAGGGTGPAVSGAVPATSPTGG
jgi:hypothetical protein